MPLVSVILPVSNGAATIKRALESILTQTLTDIELIVINNGSTDNTLEIINSFSDPRIKILNLESRNLVSALNAGISQSNSRYIARMDCDDYSYPNRLKLQSELLSAETTIGLVSGQVRYIGNKDDHLGYYTYVQWVNSIKSSQQIYLNRFCESPFAHPSVMYRRSVLENFGTYKDGLFPEDYELWLRWLDQGVRMKKIPEVVIDWYDHESRLSRNHENYSQEHFFSLKASYFKKWLVKKFNKKPLPDILIWGSGSAVRKKAKHLLENGINIEKYIDVQPTNSPNSIHYTELNKEMGIVLSYVSDRTGKKKIYDYLKENSFIEGMDFFMMA